MSKITRDDVLKLAWLSRIKLRDDEIDKFVEELGRIVEYVEQINDADVSNIQPTDQVTGLKNVMRPDETIDYGETAAELIKNAPAQENNQIKVKRVL